MVEYSFAIFIAGLFSICILLLLQPPPSQTEAAGIVAAAHPAQEQAAAEEQRNQAAANDFNTASIGDTRVVDLGNGVKLTLCYIPPGSFTMGSPASEAERTDDEDQVPVKISRGFWLAQTECTQAQWHAVMRTEPSKLREMSCRWNR